MGYLPDQLVQDFFHQQYVTLYIDLFGILFRLNLVAFILNHLESFRFVLHYSLHSS